jgi:hypothetical protein
MKVSKMMKEVKGFDAGGELAKARDAVRNSENLSEAVDEVNTTERVSLHTESILIDHKAKNFLFSRLSPSNPA